MRCATVQERLADEGVALVERDAAIREHVIGCSDCGPFREALERVQTGLSRLPAVPAPGSLISRTARAVAGEQTSTTGNDAGVPSSQMLAAALAAMVIVAAAFTLVESVQQEVDRVAYDVAERLARAYRGERFSLRDAPARPAPAAKTKSSRRATSQVAASEPVRRPTPQAPPLQGATPAPAPASAPQPATGFAAGVIATGEASAVEEAPATVARARPDSVGGSRLGSATRELDRALELPLEPPAYRETFDELPANLAARESALMEMPVLEPAPPAVPETVPETVPEPERELVRPDRPAELAVSALIEQSKSESVTKAERRASDARRQEPALGAPSFANTRDDLAQRALQAAPGKSGRVAGGKDALEQKVPNHEGAGLASAAGPRVAARRFLAERERLTGLGLQPSSGYWANTYVPGDPAIRLLEARLQRWDRSALAASLGDARLEATAAQNRQPFDLPRDAALAVYLHGDKRAVDGRSRLRVQVGLQASQKRSGLRPDMNVGVVLDVRRPVDDATASKLRALVMALARARQPGDRFSITVAGHPGGLLVPPGNFRNGPIRIAMQSLFTAADERVAPALDLLAALHAATESVRQGDDASAPLGASQILLVSTAPLGEQRASLERMAHENAVAGIGLSVVVAGDGAELASIDRLVLLGQGRRRVLGAAEDAAKLIDRELHAASRAVAHAVRLRIRLAPGVELIDVLGSENLSEQAAQRVREAERSIDQRLARNIGVRADRGEDEEGIQIVIPSFFAGDSHTVLLDVVVPGPGPVADVSVRYKDLVYKRNGVARARLAIDGGPRDPGPLERNVLKNQLAHVLAESATTAGRQLAAGNSESAARILRGMRDLLVGLRLEIPGWDNDSEIRDDVALLDRYLEALGTRYAGIDEHRRRLSDSLRYLAVRRLTPPYK